MFKMLSSSAAVVALSLQAAFASPFTASPLASESERAEMGEERGGVAAFLMNVLAATITGKAGHSEDSPRSQSYYGQQECETNKAAKDEEAKEEDAEAAEVTGPEPIYYGF